MMPFGSSQIQSTRSLSDIIFKGVGTKLRRMSELTSKIGSALLLKAFSRCLSRARPTRLKLCASCCMRCSIAEQPSASASAKEMVFASKLESFPFGTLSSLVSSSTVSTGASFLNAFCLSSSCLAFSSPPFFFQSAIAFFFHTSFFSSLSFLNARDTSLETSWANSSPFNFEPCFFCTTDL